MSTSSPSIIPSPTRAPIISIPTEILEMVLNDVINSETTALDKQYTKIGLLEVCREWAPVLRERKKFIIRTGFALEAVNVLFKEDGERAEDTREIIIDFPNRGFISDHEQEWEGRNILESLLELLSLTPSLESLSVSFCPRRYPGGNHYDTNFFGDFRDHLETYFEIDLFVGLNLKCFEYKGECLSVVKLAESASKQSSLQHLALRLRSDQAYEWRVTPRDCFLARVHQINVNTLPKSLTSLHLHFLETFGTAELSLSKSFIVANSQLKELRIQACEGFDLDGTPNPGTEWNEFFTATKDIEALSVQHHSIKMSHFPDSFDSSIPLLKD